MLKMHRATCDVNLNVERFDELVTALATRQHFGLKHSASCGILATAGLDPTPETLAACQISSRDRTLGRYPEMQGVEFFFSGDDFFSLQLGLQRFRDKPGEIRIANVLTVAHVFDSSRPDSEEKFDEFCKAVTAALADSGGSSKAARWRPSAPVPRIFRELTVAERARKPTKPDLTAAMELANRPSRDVLFEIKKVGVITVSQLENALKGAKKLPVEDVVGRLQACGLLAREYLVVCKSQSRVLVMADTSEKLQAILAEGTKCGCGRLLSEERVEEGVTPTAVAVKLTDHSKWMTVLVVKELMEAGLSEEDILTEATAGASEMDVLVNVLGNLVLLELKDREFSWGDSNAFSNKILRYDASDGIVVTTDVVAPDAKQSIEELLGIAKLRRTARPGEVPVTYVEGLEDLPSKLKAVVQQRARSAAASELSRMEPVANISIPDLLLTKFQ